VQPEREQRQQQELELELKYAHEVDTLKLKGEHMDLLDIPLVQLLLEHTSAELER
jgi:hypothetical protein